MRWTSALMFKLELGRLFCRSGCGASGAQVCYFQQHACCDIFLMLWCLLALLSGARAPSFTCRWGSKQGFISHEGMGAKSRKSGVGVISSSTLFTTDGYCLEFQGRDLMLRSPSISCRLWINQVKHKLLYRKYSPIRLQVIVKSDWNHITLATDGDTCDYGCSRQHFGDWSFIHGGTSESISVQVCVTEVDFLLSLSTLFTLTRTRGDILSVCVPPFFCLCHPGQSASAVQRGCQQEKLLLDNPFKSFFVCPRWPGKSLMGWSVPFCHPPPRFPLSLSPSLSTPSLPDPVCDVRESATWHWSVSLLSVSGNRPVKTGGTDGGAGWVECWQTNQGGLITFPTCQEGVNPWGGGANIRLNGNWVCN